MTVDIERTFPIAVFAVFVVIGLGEMHFREQVRVALSARHPDIWRELAARQGFQANVLAAFIWRRRDRALGDAALSRATLIAAVFGALTVAAWIAAVAAMAWSWSGH